jgi:DNA-binding PadR family transcriptional regulator
MERLPVSEFQILLALLAGELHGAAVRDEVAARTDGAVWLGPGTLYTSVKRLLARGWIVEVPERSADVRRVYRLTAAGRAAAAEEAGRLEQDVAHARRHRLLGGLRST